MRAAPPQRSESNPSIPLANDRGLGLNNFERMRGAAFHEAELRGVNRSSEASSPSNDPAFAPIFVMGCQRSGTTALAVMLDRHSRIAMLPETQFFNKFIYKDRKGERSHEAMARRALACPFIEETRLTHEELLHVFRRFAPTYPNLFCSLMEAYRMRHGKQRVAEKTCNHLFHVDELLRHYPSAKFICIVRDGRDVCRSIRNVPWGRHISWESLARQWKSYAREGMRLQKKLSSKVFTIVRYEDLMRRPKEELRRLCEFIGEKFEPWQLESGTATDVIPAYELDWKAKAGSKPDATRAQAWRRNETPDQIAMWNFYMGRVLKSCGYPETAVTGVSLLRRMKWAIRYIPYLPGIHPLALWVNRLLRGRSNHVERVTAEAKRRASLQAKQSNAAATRFESSISARTDDHAIPTG